MNIIEKYDKQFLFAGVFFNLLIAVRFFQLWYNPQPEQASQIATMATLIGFEFVMVHSGVFMSAVDKKKSLFILFPLYGLFAIGFAFMIDDWHIIISTYLIAVFNRMRFGFANVSEDIKSRNVLTSLLAVMVYFVLMIIVVIAGDGIAELGLTREYLSTSGYFDNLKNGGLLVDFPQTALCLGTFYYITLAFVEFNLVNHSAKKKITLEEQN